MFSQTCQTHLHAAISVWTHTHTHRCPHTCMLSAASKLKKISFGDRQHMHIYLVPPCLLYIISHLCRIYRAQSRLILFIQTLVFTTWSAWVRDRVKGIERMREREGNREKTCEGKRREATESRTCTHGCNKSTLLGMHGREYEGERKKSRYRLASGSKPAKHCISQMASMQ